MFCILIKQYIHQMMHELGFWQNNNCVNDKFIFTKNALSDNKSSYVVHWGQYKMVAILQLEFIFENYCTLIQISLNFV